MKEIRNNPQRITKIKPFINKYKWEGANVSSEKDDWKKSEKNNVIVALNIFYAKKEKIYPASVSKNNSICESDSKQERMALSCSKKNFEHYQEE